MKKFLFGLAAAALSFSAFAGSESYIGVAPGTSHYSIDCTGVASCDNNATGLKVYGGHKFGNGWAAEVSYTDFGKAKASDIGVDVALQGTSIGLGGAYFVKVGKNMEASARLGVASVKTKLTGSGAGISLSETERRVTPYAGLGFDVRIARGVKLGAGVDFSRIEFDGEKATSRIITVGVNQSF